MKRRFFLKVAMLATLVLALGPVGAYAAERGPVTNLPLPRFVSLKSNEANARRGPDTSHRIDWVYQRRNLPLRVTAEFENWRRVEDVEGQGGWMHHALLSGIRTALVQTDMTPLFLRPDTASPQTALLETGVVTRLRTCQRDWCQMEVEGARGWVEKRHIWGVEPLEEFD